MRLVHHRAILDAVACRAGECHCRVRAVACQVAGLRLFGGERLGDGLGERVDRRRASGGLLDKAPYAVDLPVVLRMPSITAT